MITEHQSGSQWVNWPHAYYNWKRWEEALNSFHSPKRLVAYNHFIKKQIPKRRQTYLRQIEKLKTVGLGKSVIFESRQLNNKKFQLRKNFDGYMFVISFDFDPEIAMVVFLGKKECDYDEFTSAMNVICRNAEEWKKSPLLTKYETQFMLTHGYMRCSA